jgi:N-acetylmuramoyl-L-alanine amidase
MRKIFISAGHSNRSGRDRGASGNGFIEGELTVELRNLIVIELKKMGVSPIVDKDDSILSESLNFLKNLTTNTCIVLDIHWNAATATATGTETLIPSQNTDYERRLAAKLSEVVSKRLNIPLRGKHAGFSGVKTEAESHHGRLGWMRLKGENVLMEICFISNPNDMRSYQANKVQLASDIANVLVEFARNGSTSATTSATNTHTVVSGDTLSVIARKYNTSVSEIKRLNNLNSDNIRIGQKLIIK